ncbi:MULTISPECIES: ZIP family metal transporter [Haloferax]|uniref:ZIP family metal transporter n=1 Tax=Haloferax marinum TaxID=2666143 RepID=A0A6A8G9E9_9EURY|nr:MULTISPECIES: ZIP family metal transporter [Haloferax]KAB1198964.1 ZIP family metal transporter [Haloferax sp. CBA1150]MRW97228.1 ZIP family metal transporter [Haloferax marinum]
MDPVIQGLVGGIVIAGFNLLGASLVFVWRNPSERALNGALGFAAGVMLAASFTSLIIPGIETYSNGNPVPVLFGMTLGALFLDRADALVPHAHYLLSGRRRTDAANPPEESPVDDEKLAGVVLFILAITLHNMPEGLAVGVGFGSGDLSTAIPLMLAIGIQNVPEGLAVSVAAINAGLDRRFYAALAGIRSGIVEIPLAVLGAYAVLTVSALLPYAMGFAAGAMLFVISDEIIPETHTGGLERTATLGTILGAIVMLYLDISLG